jgi:hypothetical protein
MALLLGDHRGGLAVVVRNFHIRSVGKEQGDHIPIPVLGGGVDWNPSTLLAGIDRRAMLQQQSGGFQVASGCGTVQRHDLRLVTGDDISSCAIL